jgi:hypothetical protein
MEPAIQRIVDRVQARQPLRVDAVLPPSMTPTPSQAATSRTQDPSPEATRISMQGAGR